MEMEKTIIVDLICVYFWVGNHKIVHDFFINKYFRLLGKPQKKKFLVFKPLRPYPTSSLVAIFFRNFFRA